MGAKTFQGAMAGAFSYLAIVTGGVFAEPVNEIVVGGYYFVKGIFEDTKVQVISVDKAGGRVKIFNHENQGVDWVAADAVITRSESVDRDIDRVQVGVRILSALFGAATKPETPARAPELPPWRVGIKHPSIANVVAGPSRNEWKPLPGYAWAKNGAGRVEWTPGLAHPTETNIVSSHKEGEWASDIQFLMQKVQLDGKRLEEERKGVFPAPPDVSGIMFERGEMDFYCRNNDYDTLHFFHSKAIPYQDIGHVIFHAEDNWVVVVLKDGRRLDLGGKVLWQVRPCFFFATGVTFGRTRDGQTQEMRRVPLFRVDSKHKVVERYLLGIRFAQEEVTTGVGKRKILFSVMDGSPAAEAGLKKGDAILAVDGKPIGGVEEVLAILDTKRGEPVDVEFWREGKVEKKSITPRLGTGLVKVVD